MEGGGGGRRPSWEREEQFRSLLHRAAKKASREMIDTIADIAVRDDKVVSGCRRSLPLCRPHSAPLTERCSPGLARLNACQALPLPLNRTRTQLLASIRRLHASYVAENHHFQTSKPSARLPCPQAYKAVCALLLHEMKQLKPAYRLKLFFLASAILRQSKSRRGDRDKYGELGAGRQDGVGWQAWMVACCTTVGWRLRRHASSAASHALLLADARGSAAARRILHRTLPHDLPPLCRSTSANCCQQPGRRLLLQLRALRLCWTAWPTCWRRCLPTSWHPSSRCWTCGGATRSSRQPQWQPCRSGSAACWKRRGRAAAGPAAVVAAPAPWQRYRLHSAWQRRPRAQRLQRPRRRHPSYPPCLQAACLARQARLLRVPAKARLTRQLLQRRPHKSARQRVAAHLYRLPLPTRSAVAPWRPLHPTPRCTPSAAAASCCGSKAQRRTIPSQLPWSSPAQCWRLRCRRCRSSHRVCRPRRLPY